MSVCRVCVGVLLGNPLLADSTWPLEAPYFARSGVVLRDVARKQKKQNVSGCSMI